MPFVLAAPRKEARFAADAAANQLRLVVVGVIEISPPTKKELGPMLMLYN